jgi:hypothetical protein
MAMAAAAFLACVPRQAASSTPYKGRRPDPGALAAAPPPPLACIVLRCAAPSRAAGVSSADSLSPSNFRPSERARSSTLSSRILGQASTPRSSTLPSRIRGAFSRRRRTNGITPPYGTPPGAPPCQAASGEPSLVAGGPMEQRCRMEHRAGRQHRRRPPSIPAASPHLHRR